MKAFDNVGVRLRIAGSAALIAVAMLGPVLLWGALARGAVVEDIDRRDAEQRLLIARLAASAIDSVVAEAGRRLDLVASRQALRVALLAGDATELHRHLADLRRGTGHATALALDPSGRLLARDPAAPETYGQSFADRDYYSGALESRAAYLSEAVVSRITGQTVVVAALAVRDGDRVLGLLLATFTPVHMLDRLRPLDATTGRELHLVDQRARVIASTDGLRAPLSELRITAAATSNGRPAASDPAERLATHTPVEGTPWTLYVSDDPSVALAAQRQLDQRLIAGAAGSVLLVLAAAAGITYLFATVTRQRRDLIEREAALERTNAELQSASRAKSDFLASMSHELRTPLNAILGFSDLLAEQIGPSLGERQSRYLRNIKEAGSHLLGLINDVLDLSKVEAGRVELRPERATLGDLVKPVLASTSAQAEVSGLAFESHVPYDRLVNLDTVRLRQILYNLLSNAVKFTARGRVVLRITAHGRDLEIEVSDTGIGIPAGMRGRVFGTFERLHEGRSDASGTGLGLALTKRLVEMQDGTILFTSVEGEGTTFHVRLPNVVVHETSGDRVLVVEDDARAAELVTALVAGLGLESEVVSTPAEALAAVRRSRPVAVVLDLRLASERGEVVLEHLRSEPATSDIPVIVVTVDDDDGSTTALGADAHMTKPIKPAALTAHLERALRGRKGEGVAAAAGR